MKRLLEWGLVAVQATLLIVSTTVVFIPSTRTSAMHAAVLSLFAILVVETFWGKRRRDMLKMTPAQIYASHDPQKPRATLLGLVASLMGAAAMVVMSLYGERVSQDPLAVRVRPPGWR